MPNIVRGQYKFTIDFDKQATGDSAFGHTPESVHITCGVFSYLEST